jgi:hypothetical protein
MSDKHYFRCVSLLAKSLKICGLRQRDPIGRIFAQLGDCLLWAVFENYRSSPYFCDDLYLSMDDVLILTKMGLATFWQFFHKLIWSPWSPVKSRQFRFPLHPLLIHSGQGNQIGRIFAVWAIFYFGLFFNYART